MIDIENPFIDRYLEGMPGASPREAYAAHKAIEEAVAVLAESGQIRVWTLQRCDEDDISGVYVTLKGAIDGARHIMADELVPPYTPDTSPEEWVSSLEEKMKTPGEEDEESQRLKYERYMFNEVQWEVIQSLEPSDEILAFLTGTSGYRVRTSYGDSSYEWDIIWNELMP